MSKLFTDEKMNKLFTDEKMSELFSDERMSELFGQVFVFKAGFYCPLSAYLLPWPALRLDVPFLDMQWVKHRWACLACDPGL